MRPDSLTYDFKYGRATVGSTVFPAKDTGFRMFSVARQDLGASFPSLPYSRVRLLPAFFHSKCVGDLESQEIRDRLDSLRILRINNRRPVGDIDAVLNGPVHELTSRGAEILG